VPDDAEIDSVILSLKTEEDNSDTDFYVRVYGGTQPIWGSLLRVEDWGCGTVFLDSWNTINYVDETYVNFTIPTGQLNKEGRTQFELASDRDITNTQPSGGESISFHSADSTGNEPKLYVTYTVVEPQGGMAETEGENWFFAGEWYDFTAVYTYGGSFDHVKFAFSDLYDSFAIDTDVNEYVSIPNDASLNVTEEVTVMCWAKWETVFSTYSNIVAKAGTLNPYNLYISNDTNIFNLRFIVTNSTGSYTNPSYDITTGYLGEWMHITGTYDGTYTKLYLDGELVSVSSSISGLIKTNSFPVYIGADDENEDLTPDYFFDGVVDNVQIFNRCLTETEINYNMDHMQPKDRLELVGLWFFDEGSGTTVYDASREVNSGTISGASYVEGQILISDHWVIAKYDVIEDDWSLESGSEIVNIQDGETETIGNNFYVTFKLFFKSTILDKLNVNIYGYSENTTGTKFSWETIAEDYFNIYNLGGQLETISIGDSGRIAGGDLFELYADGPNSFIGVTQVWRKLQHVKIQCGFAVENLNDENRFVVFGFSFQDPTAGIFENEWYANITMVDIVKDANNAYVIFTVKWYYDEVQIGSTDTLTALWETNAFNAPTGEVSGFRFHIDLWVNKANASSVVGGRVAPHTFGLTKTNPAWWDWWGWWGTDEWKPMRGNSTESMFFTDLRDYKGSIISAKTLDLIRLGCVLYNLPAGDDVYLLDYHTFGYTFAGARMSGIDTPSFTESLDPALPTGGGILSNLFSSISNLGTIISEAYTVGLLLTWGLFVSFLDTVFTFGGWPDGFSELVTAISNFVTWFTSSLSYAVSMFTEMFSFLDTIMSRFISTLVVVVTGWISIANSFFDILENTFNMGINVFDVLINSLLLPLIPVITILYFVWRFDNGGIEAVTNDIKFMVDIAAFLLHTLLSVATFFLYLIESIIEKIPGIQ